MLKKLLLTSLMCLPIMANAEDNKYPIKIPHIYTKEQWEHRIAPPPTPILLQPDYSKYPKLSLEEQKMVKNSLDLHDVRSFSSWINVKGLNSSNILEFGKNIKYLDNSFVSKINGKTIKIPTKEIFVKEYRFKSTYHPLHDCPNIKNHPDELYDSYCEYVTLEQKGYQKYIVPKYFSLAKKNNSIDISIMDSNKTILEDGITVDKNVSGIAPFIGILYPDKISDNAIKKWLSINNIDYSYKSYPNFSFYQNKQNKNVRLEIYNYTNHTDIAKYME